MSRAHRIDEGKKIGMTAIAAHGDHIDALSWLETKGLLRLTPEAAKDAAFGGCIQALEWLHQRNCPFEQSCMAAAALNGQLDAMELLMNKSKLAIDGMVELATERSPNPEIRCVF